MKPLIGVGVWLFLSSTVVAQGLHPGVVIGVIDGPRVHPQTFAADISGWAFHTGGAAILGVQVWLDCNPFTGAPCGPGIVGTALEGYARRDVQTAFPPYPVPNVAGWGIPVVSWMPVVPPMKWPALADGPHWLYGGATDAEHGRLVWTQLNPMCFTKAGSQILPC